MELADQALELIDASDPRGRFEALQHAPRLAGGRAG